MHAFRCYQDVVAKNYEQRIQAALSYRRKPSDHVRVHGVYTHCVAANFIFAISLISVDWLSRQKERTETSAVSRRQRRGLCPINHAVTEPLLLFRFFFHYFSDVFINRDQRWRTALRRRSERRCHSAAAAATDLILVFALNAAATAAAEVCGTSALVHRDPRNCSIQFEGSRVARDQRNHSNTQTDCTPKVCSLLSICFAPLSNFSVDSKSYICRW